MMKRVSNQFFFLLLAFILPIEDIPVQTDFVGVIQQMAEKFTTMASQALSAVNTTVIDVSRAAYVSVLLIGVLLYFTHLEKRLGKDLIKGGIILALLAEFVLPLIGKV
jgi:hypothetical protein